MRGLNRNRAVDLTYTLRNGAPVRAHVWTVLKQRIYGIRDKSLVKIRFTCLTNSWRVSDYMFCDN